MVVKRKIVALLALAVCLTVVATFFFVYPTSFSASVAREDTDGWHISTYENRECSLSYKLFGVGYHKVEYRSNVWCDFPENMTFRFWTNST